jgi:hypothetical protein
LSDAIGVDMNIFNQHRHAVFISKQQAFAEDAQKRRSRIKCLASCKTTILIDFGSSDPSLMPPNILAYSYF